MDDKGLMETRNKEIKLRLLDRVRVREERVKWQLINILGPTLFVLLFALIYTQLRRIKYRK